ncbi:MAG: SDR family oxidoreductase [Chloroflexi bacterium]|nr:SDR family oxidoreductase [Chloroflexota bacterium]
MHLEGRVALVTGGTSGIGAASAIALARAGADVALVARRDTDEARAYQQSILALGRRCVVLLHDVADPQECQACVDETVAQLGTVDVLLHAAGGPANGSVLDVTPEVWHHAFDVHVHAAYYLSRAVAPILKPKREGAIVLVSSVAGIRGVPGSIAYCTVKGAILEMTRALARDLADDNIRVNCVAPGIIRTHFHDPMTEERKQFNMQHRIPLHREGTAEDVAEAIALLVRNEYMTGECIVVDGGLTSRIA